MVKLLFPTCHLLFRCCTEQIHWSECVNNVCVSDIQLLFQLISNRLLFKVLFIADARIVFDTFRNSMAATVFSKTVITVNPGEKAQNNDLTHNLLCSKKDNVKWSRQCDKSITFPWGVLPFCRLLTPAFHSDTREASLLFRHVRELSESGALDLDEKPEDVTGGLHEKILICKYCYS